MVNKMKESKRENERKNKTLKKHVPMANEEQQYV